MVPANTPYGPHDARSSDARDRRAAAQAAPEISSMGAIKRGDVPKPDLEEILQRASRAREASAPSRAALGLQGTDRLVHSPTAIDFQSETTIAQNDNFVVVGFNDYRGFGLPDISVSGYAYSSDGGMTWTDGGQLPTSGGDQVFGDPDVKTWTDPNTSQIYFFYSSLYTDALGQSSLCLHVSTDGGATWVGPRAVSTATSATDFPDKEFMDVDPETGRIFISWTNFGAGTTMRVTYSDDFGLNWAGLTSFGNSGQGSVPRTDGSSSNVYIGWRRSTDIQFVRSTNNGATWSAPAAIASGLVNPMNPYGSDRIHGFMSMDVYDSNGDIYMVYASRNMAPDFSEVYFIRSVNDGVSWSSPLAINNNPGADRSQYFPWLSVDQTDGRIDVIWLDQLNGAGTSDITELFHTHSADGGLTWSCPTPLSDGPFHAEYGNTTSQPNMGDYNQCVSDNGTMYTSFAKTGEASYLTFAPDTYADVHNVGGSAAPVGFASVAFNDAGCTSANGYAEAGETIDLFVTVKNYSDCLASITGITGTISTTTPGVTILNGTESFGNLSGVGSTTSNGAAFVILLELDPGFSSGDDIELVLTLTTSAGTAALPFSLATGAPTETTLLTETFDGVAVPALPAGWTTDTATGTANLWVTSTTFAASGANSVFCADIGTMSLNRLFSPSIAVPADCDLLDVTFEVTHDIELDVERRAWDGALLRIEIDDGVVQTKLAGAFASLFQPFYPWQMNRQDSADQPLQDLSCWSANTTPNFSSVHLQFPGLAGTTVRLRFDMGTDTVAGTTTGMFVDNVIVKSIKKESICTDPPTIDAAPSPVVFLSVPVNQTTCDSIFIVNDGPSSLTIAGIGGCTTAPFSIDTSMTLHTLPPGDTTKMYVCVTPTGLAPFNCTVTVSSNAVNGPTVIPVSVSAVTAVGPAVRLPFEIMSVAPNPFNPSTSVRFSLPEPMPVTAEVWSVDGARVVVLAEKQPFAAGANEVRWDGRNDRGFPVASGIYFVRITTSLGERTARAVLLK
jgi:hypothetical protein